MSFFKKFKSLLRKFDLFGSPVSLVFSGQQKYTTAVGGLMSIVMLVTIFSVFKDTTVSFIQLRQVNFNERQEIDLNSQINLSKENFMFGIGVTNLNLNQNLYKKYFSIAVQYNLRYSNGTKIKQNFQLQPCKIQDWQKEGPEFLQFFKGNNMQRYLCINDINYELKGQYGMNEFKYLKIVIKKCVLQNEQDECFQYFQSQMYQKVFEQDYLEFNFIYSKLNVQKKNTFFPVKKSPQKVYYRFMPELQAISVDQFINNISILTDTSVVPFPKLDLVHSVQFDKEKINNIISIKSQQFFRFYLRANDKVKIIQRKVQSLDQFVSFLGGIFGAIAVLGQFLIEPLSNFLLKLKIFNRIFYKKYKNNACNARVQSDVIVHQQQKNKTQIGVFQIAFQKIKNALLEIIPCKKQGDLDQFQLVQETVSRSLDIIYLINRIHMLQKVILIQFQEEQIEELVKNVKMDSQLYISRQGLEIRLQQFGTDIRKLRQNHRRPRTLLSKNKIRSQIINLNNQNSQQRLVVV